MIESVNMPAQRTVRLFARSRLMDLTFLFLLQRLMCIREFGVEKVRRTMDASHPAYRLHIHQEALSTTGHSLSLF